VTVGAFFNEDWEMLRLATQDRFHQKVRMKMLPELFAVQKMAYDNGALMSTLSGSGSTFFNMVYDQDAQMLADKFKKEFHDFEIKILSFDNDGLVVER
jgi:homoserine kinase